jgi:hypothetical protein
VRPRHPRRPPALKVGTGGHVADAEVCWPSTEAAGPYADAKWAVQVELTLKPAARTGRIMAGLLVWKLATCRQRGSDRTFIASVSVA